MRHPGRCRQAGRQIARSAAAGSNAMEHGRELEIKMMAYQVLGEQGAERISCEA